MIQESSSSPAPEPNAKPSVNQSIERAAKLLGYFTIDEPEHTLADLTARLGTSRATAHRYATALRRAGLLRLTPKGYMLGPRLIELSTTAFAGLQVDRIAGPYLERLVGQTNETVVLSIWSGEGPVVVRCDDYTSKIVRVRIPTGVRLPLESAQGNLFRAFRREDEDPRWEALRRGGLSYNAAVVEGIAVMAGPVFQGEAIVATIALVGTISAIEADLDAPNSRHVRAAAAELSAELGARESLGEQDAPDSRR